MTPPDAGRVDGWAILHAADSCDHTECGVPAANADRECLAARITAALTTHAETIRRLEGEVARLQERASGTQKNLEELYAITEQQIATQQETIRRLEGEVARLDEELGDWKLAKGAANLLQRAEAAEGLLRETLDRMWGEGQAVRDAIVKHYGTCHPATGKGA